MKTQLTEIKTTGITYIPKHKHKHVMIKAKFIGLFTLVSALASAPAAFAVEAGSTIRHTTGWTHSVTEMDISTYQYEAGFNLSGAASAAADVSGLIEEVIDHPGRGNDKDDDKNKNDRRSPGRNPNGSNGNAYGHDRNRTTEIDFSGLASGAAVVEFKYFESHMSGEGTTTQTGGTHFTETSVSSFAN